MAAASLGTTTDSFSLECSSATTAVMILVMLAMERRASGLRAQRTRPSLSASRPAFKVTEGSAEVEMLRSAALRPSTSSLLLPAD